MKRNLLAELKEDRDASRARREAFWRGFWNGMALGVPVFMRAARETPGMYFAPILWIKKTIFRSK